MSYWQVSNTEIWSGQPVKTVGQQLFDADEDAFNNTSTWYFPATNTAGNDAWQDMISVFILIPGYVAANDYLRVAMNVDAGGTGGGTGDEDQVRLKDVASAVTGSATELTSASVTASVSVQYTGDWGDTVREFVIQGWDDSASGTQLEINSNAMLGNVYWFPS